MLRFWDLGRPKAFIFDETYYAKDAWSLLHFGVEQDYIRPADKGDPDPANAKILAGNPHGLWTGDPSLRRAPAGRQVGDRDRRVAVRRSRRSAGGSWWPSPAPWPC